MGRIFQISIDSFLLRAGHLAIAETSMDGEAPVNINFFQLASNKTERDVPREGNYSYIIKFSRRINLILITFHVHQRDPVKDFGRFLTSWLLQCNDLVDYLSMEWQMGVLMVLIRDFHLSEDGRDKLKDYPPIRFNLKLKNNPEEQTTLISSCINLTFPKHIYFIFKQYVF